MYIIFIFKCYPGILISEISLRFFSVDRSINQSGRKTASMCIAHYCKGFPSFFSVDTSIDQLNIRFICNYLVFIVFQETNSHSNPLNAGLFQTLEVVEIHMMSQLSFPLT